MIKTIFILLALILMLDVIAVLTLKRNKMSEIMFLIVK